MIAHVEGAYKEICERVANKLKIKIIYTAKENLVSIEALSNLKNVVESFAQLEILARKA